MFGNRGAVKDDHSEIRGTNRRLSEAAVRLGDRELLPREDSNGVHHLLPAAALRRSSVIEPQHRDFRVRQSAIDGAKTEELHERAALL